MIEHGAFVFLATFILTSVVNIFFIPAFDYIMDKLIKK